MEQNNNYECRYIDFSILELAIVDMVFMFVWK